MPESSLSDLRRRLERLARRERGTHDRFAMGHPRIDDWLGGGLPRGRLHEILTDDDEEAATGAGFSALLALKAAAGRPIFWLRTDAAERRGGGLYASGLAWLGVAADALLLGVVDDDIALLRAASDAAGCAGLGAVVLESWSSAPKLDLTATRRLMLAAERSGVTVLSLRLGADERPSVAETRWRVAPAPSVPLATDAPGHPVFDIALLRRRAGPAGQRWRVEWNRDQGRFQTPAGPALSGAELSLAAE